MKKAAAVALIGVVGLAILVAGAFAASPLFPFFDETFGYVDYGVPVFAMVGGLLALLYTAIVRPRRLRYVFMVTGIAYIPLIAELLRTLLLFGFDAWAPRDTLPFIPVAACAIGRLRPSGPETESRGSKYLAPVLAAAGFWMVALTAVAATLTTVTTFADAPSGVVAGVNPATSFALDPPWANYGDIAAIGVFVASLGVITGRLHKLGLLLVVSGVISILAFAGTRYGYPWQTWESIPMYPIEDLTPEMLRDPTLFNAKHFDLGQIDLGEILWGARFVFPGAALAVEGMILRKQHRADLAVGSATRPGP